MHGDVTGPRYLGHPALGDEGGDGDGEVRGYGAARRPPRPIHARSRHDFAFAAAALALAVLATYAALANLAPFTFYPTISGSFVATQFALAAAIVVIALAPFAQRRGIE